MAAKWHDLPKRTLAISS